ncbi:MAG TPA: hypothetical protein VIV35_02985 [Chitinophagaceae bacterium]
MKSLLLIPILTLFFIPCSHGSSTFNDSLLIGTWKGTSICQIKPSACHDEIAVYHVSKGEKPGIYHIVANKIVNGKEEDMGVDDFIFNPADHSLFCFDEKYKVILKFTGKGKSMNGTLELENKVYRVIKLEKISQ